MSVHNRDPVATWKQTQPVYLWRYIDNTRNYPGWHLSLDPLASESLLALVGALQGARNPVHRTLEITPPTLPVLRVPNNLGGEARWASPEKWKIAFVPGLEDAQLWEFPVTQTSAVLLRLGNHYLDKFTSGLNDLLSKVGDYSIGGHPKEARGSETVLWFWWQ
jgi:hypothetical protein